MNFIETFTAARTVSTPLVAVRTPDAASTIDNVRKALGADIKTTPLMAWDAIHGLKGLDGNDKLGAKMMAHMVKEAGLEDSSTSVDLAITLGLLEFATTDVIVFVHNPHMIFEKDSRTIQGVWNLRDSYKANGNMLIMLEPLGTVLPSELNNDVLMIDEPLPTRTELEKIVESVYAYAECKKPAAAIVKAACDALVGIAAFPSEQSVAMSLDKATGKLDIKQLWTRKRQIVSTVPGLSFAPDNLKLSDMGGLDNLRNYGIKLMKGKRGANVLLRMDEVEKQFAGTGTDSSGSTGKLLGSFLSWVEDKKILCMLLVGVPGASKSHFVYCLGGEFGVPVLNFDVSAMEDKHVGEGNKNLKRAQATVEAISDGQIILIATANNIAGLPAELISRFEKGGIFFVDAPTAQEREDILALKTKKFNLGPEQTKVTPNITGWTGREIEAMCEKADNLGDTLSESAAYVVPLTKSHKETIKALRQSSHDRYLSATNPGLYQYDEAVEEVPAVPVATGRKMR